MSHHDQMQYHGWSMQNMLLYSSLVNSKTCHVNWVFGYQSVNVLNEVTTVSLGKVTVLIVCQLISLIIITVHSFLMLKITTFKIVIHSTFSPKLQHLKRNSISHHV